MTARRSVPNRPPLAPSPLVKLPVGAVTPRGWLRTQLELMRDGFVGNLPRFSAFCRDDSGWLNPDTPAWEELPYWLKGYGDLGYVLKDEKIIAAAKRWIDAAIASQQEDGWFGPRDNKAKRDGWPNMIMLDALRSRHEATGDKRIVPMMTRYFEYRAGLSDPELFPYQWGVGTYNERWWQHVRAGDELESIYWLYNRTGDERLLKLAERMHRLCADWTAGVPTWHGVNICQGFREPAVFYQQSKDAAHLAAARRTLDKVYDMYGQVPGGMFGADEDCRPGYDDPRQAAETCSMVELMHSCQSLLKITGDLAWADWCEDVAFNSLPAAVTPDWRGLHYLTAPNMVQLDSGNKAPGLQNSGCMLAYSPRRYRCCQHNVAMGWPYYAEHLWMATPDAGAQPPPAVRSRGLAAVLYAPCEVTAIVGPDDNAAEVTIVEETEYPFDSNVTLRLRIAKPVRFPLSLRVPGWCESVKIAVNGKPQETASRPGRFVVLDRDWNNGDVVQVSLPMEVRVTTWKANHDAVSVHRGPLTYSLKIKERWVNVGDDSEWPDQEVYPDGPWNYGLVLDPKKPEASFQVVLHARGLRPQPFVPDSSPVELRAKARRIAAWTQDRLGLVGPLQQSPARGGDDVPAETVTLIPMGCARLRIAAFPTVSDEAGAHEWVAPKQPPHAASHEHDDIAALSDGVRPKHSNDHDIPRFTWWARRGTTEWVTYRFDRPRTVAETSVYWFDDTGRGYCRVPASWRLYYRSNGEWRPVTGASDAGTERDRFNRLTFDPVETDELKLEAALQPGFSGGILEWIVGRSGPS